jgi:thioredoxin-like negative regulator of GroEL
VIARDPADGEARLALARAHWYAGRAEPAAAHYLIALASRAEDPALVAEVVGVLRAAGRPALAGEWLERGLAAHPGHPDLRVARAAARAGEGELDAAERELEAVLAEHPDHEAAGRELAALRGLSPVERAERMSWAGDLRAARRLLRSHLAEDPRDEAAARALALYSAWATDYAESQRLYRGLLEARPGDRELRAELAEVTSWRGQYADARDLFAASIEEDPSDLRARLGLANVHLWSGVHRPADRELRGILADAPGDEAAAAQLLHLRRIRAPSGQPSLSFFRDSEDFTLWTSEVELLHSPRPGSTLSLRLDGQRADGEVGAPGGGFTDRESATGYGFRAGFEERPDRPWAFGAELGAVHYEGAAGRPGRACTRAAGSATGTSSSSTPATRTPPPTCAPSRAPWRASSAPASTWSTATAASASTPGRASSSAATPTRRCSSPPARRSATRSCCGRSR